MSESKIEGEREGERVRESEREGERDPLQAYATPPANDAQFSGYINFSTCIYKIKLHQLMILPKLRGLVSTLLSAWCSGGTNQRYCWFSMVNCLSCV